MATWELSTQWKKSAIEKQFWYKDGQVAIRTEGYRWGTFTTESDTMPEIDLADNDEFELDADWELVSLDDGCWAEWEWPDDMDEEEQERLEAIWDDEYFEGLEEEGWSQDDTEYYFQGPLKLVNLDTGEEFTGNEESEESKETDTTAVIKSTNDDPVRWPFDRPKEGK
jgi:D-alanyl-D-alanine carboxypeptidase